MLSVRTEGKHDSRKFLMRFAWCSVVVAVVVALCVVTVMVNPSLAVQSSTTSAVLNTSNTSNISNSSATTVTPTGKTTTAKISVGTDGMSFTPSNIKVPAGNKLVIKFHNTGNQQHDLVMANGATTGRVTPGGTATVSVGVISANMQGWCSVAGHRQMGMTLSVAATGSSAESSSSNTLNSASSNQTPSGLQSNNSQSNDVETPSYSALHKQAKKSKAYDANMPELTGASGTDRYYTMTVTEGKMTISNGVTQKRMYFNGTAPGPVLRGEVGDTFHITLVNKGTEEHSIDFHAGDDASPDTAMKSISPGENLEYTFTASSAGIWMYHCSTSPMSNHIANGMHGAVIIEPKGGLEQVDREYVLVASEMYLGENDGLADAAKISALTPDIMTFNGRAFQYDEHPLAAKAGEKVRIWVLNAGPNEDLSFHVVGTQFSTVFGEGQYSVKDGVGQDSQSSSGSSESSTTAAQVLPLAAAQGGFVEMTFKTAGSYSFVNHVMSYAEKGQHGIIKVTE